MIRIFLFLLIAAITVPGCKSWRTTPRSSTDLTNTRWTYKDDDMSYEITFKARGVLSTTHPSDQTPKNDTWEQRGEDVTFWYNDKYSTYTGKMNGLNSITGTAKNSVDSWAFTMTRIQ